MNLSKLYSAGNMNITGHEDSDESDYEIEHNGYIQSETSEGKDRNNNEVEEHQNVQHWKQTNFHVNTFSNHNGWGVVNTS